jgi:hypothetical protein
MTLGLVVLAVLWYVGLLALLAVLLAGLIAAHRFFARHRLAGESLVEVIRAFLDS